MQDIHDSKIEINQYLSKSADYQDLIKQEQRIAEFLSYVPEENLQKRLELSRELEEHRKRIEEFKRDVIRLAEMFNAITINTERLKEAKRLFEEGKFREADTVLNVEELQKDQNALLAALDKAEQSAQAFREQLRDNATEYLIKAQTTALRFENPRRFEDACRFFEESIQSSVLVANLYAYAGFLHYHGHYHRSVKVYQRTMLELKSSLDGITLAKVYNDLGNAQAELNDYKAAIASYQQVLDICRSTFGSDQENAGLPELGKALYNLGVLHSDHNAYELASKALIEAKQIFETSEVRDAERNALIAAVLNAQGTLQRRKHNYLSAFDLYISSLDIYSHLAKEERTGYYVQQAAVLNNLAMAQYGLNRFDDALESYEKALKIFRILAELNPQAYLPEVALTLNNLCVLQRQMQLFPSAMAFCAESSQIYKELAQVAPEKYSPDVAMVLMNQASISSDQGELDSALETYMEALKLYEDLASDNMQTYLPSVALLWNNIGVVYKRQGDFASALSAHEAALRIRRELSDVNPEPHRSYIAMSLCNMGSVHQEMGEDRAALEYYLKSLEIHEELALIDPEAYLPEVASVLRGAGSAWDRLGYKSNALSIYAKALEIYNDLARSKAGVYLSQIVSVSTDIGILKLQQNDTDGAITCFSESLLLLRGLVEDDPDKYIQDFGSTLVKLAILYRVFKQDSVTSTAYAVEAESVLQPFIGSNPRIHEDYSAALKIIGSSKEEWRIVASDVA